MSRDPRAQVRGHIFPAATQARGLTASVYWGDAGEGEHPIQMYARPDNAGRDTLPDRRRGAADTQWDPAFGMEGANDSIRMRFLNSINLGKFIRPTIGAYMNGRSDMRPSAVAIHPRVAGEPLPVSRLPGGRMVAPGRVTRWEQASLIWPQMGKGGN